MIGTGGERGSGRSVLAAQQDDDDDFYSIIILIIKICFHTVMWYQVFFLTLIIFKQNCLIHRWDDYIKLDLVESEKFSA